MSAKNAIRDTLARLLFAAGITAPRVRAPRVLSIVTFHRVLPEAERAAYPYPDLAVTPAELDELLAYFSRHFDCGTLARQHRRLLRGTRDGAPLLAVTFDDAQVDNHRHARPVLERHGVKATFFAPVDAVERSELLWHDRLGFAVLALHAEGPSGRKRLQEALADAGVPAGRAGTVKEAAQAAKRLHPEARQALTERLADAARLDAGPEFARLMTFEELAELAAAGHEIGSHSMTHRMMPECDDAQLAYEVGESKRVLESRLQRPVESFCFPNGDSDSRTAAAVAGAGYQRAVTTQWGDNRGDSDRFRLRRHDMVSARVTGSDGRVSPALAGLQMSPLYARYRDLRQGTTY